MNKNCGVYMIKTSSNTVYIGSSANLLRRKNDHLRQLKDNRHCNKNLQHSWNKNGVFEFEVLQLTSEEDLIKTEQFFIDEYLKKMPLANHAMTAGSRRGVPHSEKSKEKIRSALKGKKHSEESKQKMRKPKSKSAVENMKKAQQNKSELTKNKISETLKGHEVTELTRSKLSKASEELWQDKLYREKQSVARRRTHCKRGHEFTEETTSYDSSGKRFCRLCRNERVREWRKNRSAV